MSDEENTTVPAEEIEKLEHLCETYAASMFDPYYDRNTLIKQAHMLDALLYEILKNPGDNVQRKDKRYHLALRMQKQCMDTLQTVSKIEYLKTLSHPAQQARPLPVNKKEQSE